jgi:hypothetical protein
MGVGSTEGDADMRALLEVCAAENGGDEATVGLTNHLVNAKKWLHCIESIDG